MDLVTLDSLIVDLHLAYKNVVSEADELLSRHGLARSHHKVLFFVARNSMCRSSDVQTFLGITRQAIQRPLTDLHRRLLIESVVAPQNRRIHLLRITPEGHALEQQASSLIQRHFETAFEKLTADQLQLWRQTMKQLSLPLVAQELKDAIDS